MEGRAISKTEDLFFFYRIPFIRELKINDMLKKQYLKNKPACKVTFTLPKEAAAGASEVKVLGDFNDWSWENGAPMKAVKNEYTATLELETGRSYQFRYTMDHGRWENDYQADGYVPNEFGGDNSVLTLDASPAPEKKATSAKKAAAPKKAAAKTTKAPAKKAAAPQKAAPAADDLKKIEGIGPKIEKLFNEAGINTFDALAKATKKTLTDILAAAGPRFKMHDPTTWTQQAKLAAKGEWDKLAKLQDELKGGRK